MKVSSNFAPPSPGSPASFASGMFANSGCALLTMSAAISTAALDACPAAAALPVSGNSTPTFTGSAARTRRTPVAKLVAAAPAPARTARRFTPRFAICSSLRTLADYCFARAATRHCGLASRRVASPAQTKEARAITVNDARPDPHAAGADVAMPYDVTIITVKPNTHAKALPPLEQWLKANPRKGEFLACLACDIGALNQILLLHHYASEADLAADRDAIAYDTNPF